MFTLSYIFYNYLINLQMFFKLNQPCCTGNYSEHFQGWNMEQSHNW